MLRAVFLVAAGAVLVGLGVVSIVTAGGTPTAPAPRVADRSSPAPVEATTPARPAGRARTAHPERVPFEPTSVAFVDTSGRDTAAVDRVRTLADGVLELPPDPARMGWWEGGSSAGAPYGSVVLAGHLDSRELGVGFSALMSELDVGEQVVVTDDDQLMTYVVTDRFLQPSTSVAALAALFSDRGAARLVLLTCGGTYDQEAGAYSDNLVVEARPVGRPRAR
ncbi:class F sortase [uncultured Nocardioides sp.]|uniref:Peptidase C60, sortase A and B n=1 Tax=uncultured Nocardioides sp. TaxID=198441 RepID=A0A6J4P0N4_9ACTN|nr:class F sortase [uncultured Nocardioides sp.]CAA9400966.1 MAG: hypothetical protein AVDCRST_MAG06-2181 [uncultured Nocardioides sp.]